MRKIALLIGLLAAFGTGIPLAWALVYRAAQSTVAASPVTGSAPGTVCTNVSSPASNACGINLAGVTGIRVCVASKNLTTGVVSGTLSGTGTLIGYLYDLEPDQNQQPGANARWKPSGSLTLTIPATCGLANGSDCCFSDVTTQVKHGRALWVPSGVGYSGGSATGVEVSEEAFYSGTPGR